MTSLPAGRYEVIVIVGDRSIKARRHGPFDVSIDGDPAFSGVIVESGEVRDLKGIFALGRARLTVTFMPGEGADWIANGIVVRPVAPVLAHVPPRTVVRGKEAAITLSASSPRGIEGADLCLVSGRGTRKIPMVAVEPGLLYQVVLSGDDLPHQGALEYWFEAHAEAEAGSGRRSRLPPSAASARTFSLLPLPGDATSPQIVHVPIERADPGRDVTMHAEVDAERPIRFVRLHYRYTNQYYDWQVVPMDGDGVVFEAVVPGDYIVSDWDLMYYLEAVDQGGQGSFAPEPDPTHRIPYWVVRVER